MRRNQIQNFAVFVTSINKLSSGSVVATAVNGSVTAGPSTVTWEIPLTQVSTCHIGKKYTIAIEEAK